MQPRKLCRHLHSWAVALTLAALVTSTAQANHGRQADVRQPPTRIVTVEAGSGFDWGDASIGGAGVLGVTLIAAGIGLLLVRRNRAAANSDPPALVSRVERRYGQ